MSSIEAFHACTRFGLGPRGNELATLGDPRGWLLSQLRNPSIPAQVAQRVGGDRLQDKTADDGKMLVDEHGNGATIKDVYKQETFNRFSAQCTSTQPFIERLTLFWSNHFTVSIQKAIVAGLANRYEVEAIRPHVTGYFKDMLLASARHPAMLLYLDNAQSIGPNSIAGERRGKGLNENLAREIMELHTLGVNGGYSQADVTSFARILTGWSFERGEPGMKLLRYQFQPRFHEPGSKQLLGHTFAEAGEQEGIDALTMLAAHPATARHIATQLAHYFIADNPPQSAVDALAASFTQSGGHLGTVAQTLVNLKESWAQPLAKFKDPYDYAFSIYRLIDFVPEQKQFFGVLESLDYRVFNATSPAGYTDQSAEWASPDAVKKRIEYAYRLGQKMPAGYDPMALAQQAVGPVLKPTTEQAIKRAASGKDGIALLLSSPEFLRR